MDYIDMASLPRFSFPLANDLDLDLDPDPDSEPEYSPPSTSRPHIQLQTRTTTGLAVPTRQSLSTGLYTQSPPNTPTKTHVYTTTMADSTHGFRTVTPSSTPMGRSRSASSSMSSVAGSLSSLRRGDSTSSHSETYRKRNGSNVEEENIEIPGEKYLKVFKYWQSDYEIKEKDKQTPLGSGLWSDVYLASPCLPTLQAAPVYTSRVSTPVSIITPPITPVKSRTSASGLLPSLSGSYAIKHPVSKTSKAVLGAEAKVLSYLHRFPDCSNYVVPFYGQDMRTEALVLKAMDTTLDSFILQDLNSLSEPARAQRLASVFQVLARDLISGLEWLKTHGVVHADVKPSNILLDTSSPITALYSDFSSSLCLASDLTCASTTAAAPLGGGTWDYLDPLLLSSKSPTTPTPQSDLWSLAVTLLTVVIGSSPFDGAGSNVFRRREMVKQGAPLSYVGYGDDGPRNMARLRGLGKGWGKWFEMVLVKEAGKRVDVETWMMYLEEMV